MVSVQFTVLATSPTCVTVIVPGQLSVAVTVVISAGGTVALHPSVRVAGQVIVGGVTSTVLVMICVQVVELPHVLVAR